MPAWVSHPRIRFLLWAILVLMFTWPFFLPEIVSGYWHIRFGDSTTFRGWKVYVPKGWWAFTREDLLIIQKPLRFYQSENAPTISFELLHPGEKVDPEVLKDITIGTNSKRGYILQEDKPIQAGNNHGYCLDFRNASDKDNVRISCYLPEAHLFIDLFSRPSETQTLYYLVEHISPAAGSDEKAGGRR